MDTTSPTGIGAEGATDPSGLLAQADALRDAGDWIEAAVAYAAYLRLRPEDWPIWAQYGHCMKESGDTKAALLLYREAERLHPSDSDLHSRPTRSSATPTRIGWTAGTGTTCWTAAPGTTH
jgi:tetratricopeptide (TPR) repeat protein